MVALALQVLGILCALAFVYFVWPPLVLLTAGAALFALGFALEGKLANPEKAGDT